MFKYIGLFYLFVIVAFGLFLAQSMHSGNIYEFFESNKIPKIIHQTAPSNKSYWPSVWNECQKSWLYHFKSPEFQYIMWTDEDLDNLIQTHFSDFYYTYSIYTKNIKKIDIARYFILYKYGGIYADMDYKCFTNFYNMVSSSKVSISESPHVQNEYLQNALMISPKEHPFWLKVIEKAKKRASFSTKPHDVLYETGPVLISDTYFENPTMVDVLAKNYWNPNPETPNNPNIITRHYGTVTWN